MNNYKKKYKYKESILKNYIIYKNYQIIINNLDKDYILYEEIKKIIKKYIYTNFKKYKIFYEPYYIKYYNKGIDNVNYCLFCGSKFYYEYKKCKNMKITEYCKYLMHNGFIGHIKIICFLCNSKRIYFDIKYHKRKEFQKIGGKFDNYNKKWYLYSYQIEKLNKKYNIQLEKKNYDIYKII